MQRMAFMAIMAAAAITGYLLGFYVQPAGAPPPMAGVSADAPSIPPVAGYSEGKKVLFLHTETSDPKIAKILTDMMGSPVPVVPSLAQAPKEMLGRVYVYTNGVKPDGPRGPLGFQPDVFENPPGDDRYTPIRKVYLVTWKKGSEAGIQKSAAKMRKALQV